jgi:hypothetical protein
MYVQISGEQSHIFNILKIGRAEYTNFSLSIGIDNKSGGILWHTKPADFL